jgi:arsenical-resistance protein 2
MKNSFPLQFPPQQEIILKAMTETQSKEWWASLPAPRSTPPSISADTVMQLFDDMDLIPSPRTFLLVDVRRTDWEGGTIKTSLNLPAQSFYQTRKTLFDVLDRGGFKMVIFYCGELNLKRREKEDLLNT